MFTEAHTFRISEASGMNCRSWYAKVIDRVIEVVHHLDD